MQSDAFRITDAGARRHQAPSGRGDRAVWEHGYALVADIAGCCVRLTGPRRNRS